MRTLDADVVSRFTVARLVELVPGSSRKVWSRLTRELVAAGVLRKRGKAFFGRRSAIEQALVGESDGSRNRRAARAGTR